MSWLTRRKVGVLLALAFVIGLIEFLPAYWFESRINAALPAPWRISVSGSVWDGFGVLQSGQTDMAAVPLTWKFNPKALTELRAAWNIAPDGRGLSGNVSVGAGWRSLEISDASLNIDADMLSQMFPVVALLAPSGSFRLHTPAASRLTIDYGNDFRARGAAEINVDNLGLRPTGPQTLGSYLLKITARDTVIDYQISQSSGALKLDGGGRIQIASPRALTYTGYVTPSPSLPENVLSQLNSAGRVEADGRVRIEWKTQW